MQKNAKMQRMSRTKPAQGKQRIWKIAKIANRTKIEETAKNVRNAQKADFSRTGTCKE